VAPISSRSIAAGVGETIARSPSGASVETPYEPATLGSAPM